MRWAVLAALLATGPSVACVHSTLDRTTLRGEPAFGLTVQDVPVRGFAVVAVTDAAKVRGELLAVDEYSLWIETADGRAVAVPRNTVSRVRVYVHQSHGSAYAGWTAAGAASAFTHGWLALFTVPAWALAGGINAGVETSLSRGYARRAELDVLRQYARFPQGPPRALTGEPLPPLPQPPPLNAPPLNAPSLGEPPPGEIPPPPPAYGSPTPQQD